MSDNKIIEPKQCCYTAMENCIHSRRCFMTGEYCSKQSNIQKEKKALYKKGNIRAFVIMNFSDMSDVVYKWRLRHFIQNLNKYLYIDENEKRLYCSYQPKETLPENLKKVNKIEVVRADSDPASNYVVCSRICQQMQIADLIIVDVSAENTNVFYEFGMAVALGKMILPICYSESFYKRITKGSTQDYEEVEHHIGCYPWRKALFEYYGIHYKNPRKNIADDKNRQQWKTEYLQFEKVKNKRYGFSDRKYDLFPYHEKIGSSGKKIGEEIYNKLRDQYNQLASENNTLVVYTIEGFLNEEQAALCIVNFYYNITLSMHQEECFCGERVGVLAQSNYVLDSVKDSPEQSNLPYSIAEIIHLGMNQATHDAQEEKVKTEDFLKLSSFDEYFTKITDGQKEGIIKSIKGHITNRGMLIYPNNPVYVNRVKNRTTGDVLRSLEDEDGRAKTFCLYHVMLRTLRYTNEVVVDISNNCLQSLFWLGAAHGSDIYAITVLHEETEKERKSEQEGQEKKLRNIFDVAGLWTAVFRSYDTEGFYRQLKLAQVGIERHSRLLSPSKDIYERDQDGKVKGKDLLQEELVLESYYRRHFWNPMHCYNRLRLYLQHVNNNLPDDNEPRRYMVKWDIDAVAELSHYLSKRTVIGEYNFVSLGNGEKDQDAKELNFICIGERVCPLEKSFPQYIKSKMGKEDGGYSSELHEYREKIYEHDCLSKKRIYKGFANIKESESGFFTQHPQSDCLTCNKCYYSKKEVYKNQEELDACPCTIGMTGEHIELAQLILWRDNPGRPQEESHFQVGLIGSSGPATYALSMLFVDEEQRRRCFEEENQHFLCELQTEIRKKFMKMFIAQLHKKLEEMELKTSKDEKLQDEQKETYIELVEYAVSLYLSSVLYRYFLPFLSEDDIKRIYNGMHMFVVSMKAARVSPFALKYAANGDPRYDSCVSDEGIEEVVKIIPELLRSVLQRFQGVETFYEVEVKCDYSTGVSELNSQDTRKVQNIKMLRKEEPVVNCIWGQEYGDNPGCYQ